jgi:hypothetical protein
MLKLQVILVTSDHFVFLFISTKVLMTKNNKKIAFENDFFFQIKSLQLRRKEG